MRQWAPSRWSSTKVRHHLTRVKFFLRTSEWDCLGNHEAVTSALMAVDIAISELEMVHQRSFRIIEPAKNKLGFKEKICGHR